MNRSFWGGLGIIALIPVIAAFATGPKIGGSEAAARLLAGQVSFDDIPRAPLKADAMMAGGSANGIAPSSAQHQQPRVNADPVNSDGGNCIRCAGYFAGANWAEQHTVTSESQCGGRSPAFREGCKGYARDHEKYPDTSAGEVIEAPQMSETDEQATAPEATGIDNQPLDSRYSAYRPPLNRIDFVTRAGALGDFFEREYRQRNAERWVSASLIPDQRFCHIGV